VESGGLDEMRHLHRSRVRAEVVGTPPDLSVIAGVHDLTVDGSVVSCGVDAEALPQVLTALTAAGVRTLTSTPPTLEELFLDAYRGPAASPAGDPAR
jgi:ABC-2 type transport system ATP-binding protein